MKIDRTADDWKQCEIEELLHYGVPAGDIAEAYNMPITDVISTGTLEPAAVMQDFIIPVEFKATGFIKVRALSAEDAIDLARKNEAVIPIPNSYKAAYDDPNVTLRSNISSRNVMLYTNAYKMGLLSMVPKPTNIESETAIPELSTGKI